MSNIANNLETTREMKDSGEWTGKIPKHWNSTKLCRMAKVINGYSFKSDLYTDSGISVIRITNIQNGYVVDKNPRYYPLPYKDVIKEALLEEDDVLMTLTGDVGQVGLVKAELLPAGLNQRVAAIRVHDKNLYNKFMYYLFNNGEFEKTARDFSQGTAQLNMSTEWLKQIKIPLPHLNEQQAIANYLDEHVAKIDELIAEQNQAIENWKSYKQSLITETVTKGLNSNVEMKDSGIEWIGEIPKDWGIRKVKDIFKIGRGRVISKLELVDDGIYPVFSSQTLNNGCLGYINTYDFDCKQLTWTTDGANAGEVFYREGKHNCTNVCGTLQLKNKWNSLKFHSYYLRFATQYYKRPDINGAKIMNNEMANILLLIPPLHEQQAIANYLDEKCSKIEQIIEQKQTLINQLEEYKQSLIYECVTGKRCVL